MQQASVGPQIVLPHSRPPLALVLAELALVLLEALADGMQQERQAGL